MEDSDTAHALSALDEQWEEDGEWRGATAASEKQISKAGNESVLSDLHGVADWGTSRKEERVPINSSILSSGSDRLDDEADGDVDQLRTNVLRQPLAFSLCQFEGVQESDGGDCSEEQDAAGDRKKKEQNEVEEMEKEMEKEREIPQGGVVQCGREESTDTSERCSTARLVNASRVTSSPSRMIPGSAGRMREAEDDVEAGVLSQAFEMERSTSELRRLQGTTQGDMKARVQSYDSAPTQGRGVGRGWKREDEIASSLSSSTPFRGEVRKRTTDSAGTGERGQLSSHGAPLSIPPFPAMLSRSPSDFYVSTVDRFKSPRDTCPLLSPSPPPPLPSTPRHSFLDPQSSISRDGGSSRARKKLTFSSELKVRISIGCCSLALCTHVLHFASNSEAIEFRRRPISFRQCFPQAQ